MEEVSLVLECCQYMFTDEKGRNVIFKITACDNGSFDFTLYINFAAVQSHNEKRSFVNHSGAIHEVLGTHWVPIMVSEELRQYEKKRTKGEGK